MRYAPSMLVDVAVCTASPRRTVIATPGSGPPRPVIVPVTTHAAAVGGACCAITPAVCANNATPPMTATAAEILTATRGCAGTREAFMTLLPWSALED